MLYIGAVEIAGSDDHEGFVAGLLADGGRTDIWTDVRRDIGRQITAYSPGCECGWQGRSYPPDQGGYAAAQQDFVLEHFALLESARPVLAARDRPLCPATDFLSAAEPKPDPTAVAWAEAQTGIAV